MEQTIWIIPCNVDLYDPFSAFSDLTEIDWRQSCKMNAGDEVLIYCTKPYKKIMFRTKVLKTNIPNEEMDKRDLKYHKSASRQIGRNPRYGYVRLKCLKTVDTEQLGLEQLLQHGLHSAPQGACRVKDMLLEYINQYI